MVFKYRTLPFKSKKAADYMFMTFFNQKIELMTESTNPKPRNRLEHGGKKKKKREAHEHFFTQDDRHCQFVDDSSIILLVSVYHPG